jgi:hypothetical protein
MSEFTEYIKLVFEQQYLVEQVIQKNADLDAQDRFEQEKFIVSLA